MCNSKFYRVLIKNLAIEITYITDDHKNPATAKCVKPKYEWNFTHNTISPKSKPSKSSWFSPYKVETKLTNSYLKPFTASTRIFATIPWELAFASTITCKPQLSLLILIHKIYYVPNNLLMFL